MTNETLKNKLYDLCKKYIIDSQLDIEFENHTKKNFCTIMSFLGYYPEENEEMLIIKRTMNSKNNILALNKEEIFKEYEDRRYKNYERIKNRSRI